ncbi:MAG: hypothetical protein WEB89_05900 [Balneolales bacterium]
MTENSWINIEVKDNETKSHAIGPVTVWLKKVSNEIWIASEYAESNPGRKQASSKINALNWSRWALPGNETQFSLKPSFPDRPVVVKPEYPFKIITGAKVRIYTRIPVFIKVVIAGKPDFVITEIPSVALLKTWFGLHTEGELCYGVNTSARRVMGPEAMQPWMAVCPIEIINNQDGPLDFDNLCLRVEYLSIYKADNHLWADETRIIHQGREKYSDIEMKGKLPTEAKGGKLITKPRAPIKKNFAARSFKLLKNIRVWD